ncbi:MAG: transcription repressor NadR [Kosmotogaceae bacterium]
MNREQRLQKIIDILNNSRTPVSGNKLTEKLNVSRQMIVKDISLLRTRGYEIRSTSRGYIYYSRKKLRKMVVVSHAPERIGEELRLIVNNHGRVLDVIVEHPVYGELKGRIDVASVEDVSRFLARLRGSNAFPLLKLSSEGIHMHTIEVDNEDHFDLILKKLDEAGFLVK